ncbi:uncharacterized protein AMSG_07081 [Thecamonas trahens ATCC 50062]|uniref:Uncharacterized protein n=1 Tax=Thecamonas trahens ATCC 50062 TaxID=461836 RepID=A0A0L0DG57_THETB|nr:hypothetical protein AMSG_07081 [Thecamonas trahens ATCC 50062]KNC51091.1 hypothetical protein AMSG_07081 [Thecamonas trahens ATCC 50062]|eukprot:XP_013756544.1 hypothetical protein AMSG_07081 [Thecamonas trahens ATCC 50062]
MTLGLGLLTRGSGLGSGKETDKSSILFLAILAVVPMGEWEDWHVAASVAYFAAAFGQNFVSTAYFYIWAPPSSSYPWYSALNLGLACGLSVLLYLFHERIVWFDIFGIHQLAYAIIEAATVACTVASYALPLLEVGHIEIVISAPRTHVS